MNLDEALDFLRRHQPMPPDDQMTQEVIVQFDEVRKFLEQHPDKRAIPLLLGAYGNGTGFGVYQLVDGIFTQFPAADVVPCLIETLRSDATWTRSWAAEVALNFPSVDLVAPLETLLDDPSEDVRAPVVSALGRIDTLHTRELLAARLLKEDSSFVREMIVDELAERGDTR